MICICQKQGGSRKLMLISGTIDVSLSAVFQVKVSMLFLTL